MSLETMLKVSTVNDKIVSESLWINRANNDNRD